MSEQLLTILKFCLLALLYLFFLRVLRAVWVEMNPPKVATEGYAETVRRGSRRRSRQAQPKPVKHSSGVPTRLVVKEPANRAGTEFVLGDDCTVGRAQGCSIVLDEQYVSQVHARFFVRGDTLFVEDLGSTNGTWVNGTRAVGQTAVRVGSLVQIGNLVMEAR